MKQVAVFLLSIVFIGCKQASIAHSPTEPFNETPKDLAIILERDVCFGTCPAYKLTIEADGSVRFEGRHFVKKKGTVKSVISQVQLKQIVAEFEKAKYFRLKDRYEYKEDGCAVDCCDQPMVNTSITIRGKTKSIKHYHSCEGPLIPKELTELENKIDEIVKTSEWLDESKQ